MSRRKQRKIIQTKDRKQVDVSSTPYTAGYKPVPHIWFHRPIDLPPFSFATIRGMLLDPGVRLNFATRAAPICSAQFGYEQQGQWIEGIECQNPEIGAFVYRQLQKIWHKFLPCILRSQVWGWSAGEVVLKLTEAGVLEIDKMEPRHAADCRILKQDYKRWGVAINRVEGEGTINLPFPYAWFHSYNAEDGDDYGVSAALGGYSPWAEKWFNGGALDVRRLFMHKDAYAGADLGYPDGETWVPGVNEPVPNVDIARQIVEQLTSGGVTVRPSERDENGNEKWPLTRAQVANNPQHILQYPKDLDQEIRQGMEIADDVVSADGGGAWAGKRVTIASFYASLDQWLVQIVCDLKEQLLDPLVLLNWGKVPEYEIKHKPLAEQAMEQQSNAGPGGPQPPGQPQPGMDSPGMPPPDQGMGAMPGMPPGMPQMPGMDMPQMMSLAESLRQQAKELSVQRLSSVDANPSDDDYEMTADRIEAIAELLAAIYGDSAEDMLDEILPEAKPMKLAVWNPDDHPRGKDGRFIPKGSDEAYSTAKSKVDEAHRSRSPESMSSLLTHMNTLTVKQLHALKKDYGTKAAAKTKAALIAKLSERLISGRHRTERRENDTPVAPVREEVYTVPTAALDVDPTRFQYKVKGIGAKGVGEELKGTSKWNPELGGVLLVWRDPDNGKDYVVNGHHRHELATRAGADQLNVRYIDAPSSKIARSVGALANIAEGRGSAVDAAKYLRDTGQDTEHFKRAGISMSGKVAADAAVMTRLSDAAFQSVTNGTMEEDKAVAVAKHLQDMALQDKLFKKLQQREDDGKDWSLREIEAAAKKMAKAGSVKQSGTDLFGDWESEESTFDQEVEIESYITRQLATEANDFAAVSSTRRAERVSETGNVLNVDANLQKRDSARSTLSDFERESGLKGPVAEAIKAQAAKLAKAKNRKEREEIKAAALADVREAMQPKPGIVFESRSNEEAKPGDQLGMFGEVSNVPRGTPRLDQVGETQGKQTALFETGGDPNQGLLFDDGVDDRFRPPETGDEKRKEKSPMATAMSLETPKEPN